MHQPQSTANFTLFVGIDVAARTARVRWVTANEESDDGLTIPQTASGMIELRKYLLGLCPEAEGIQITMEASGSYYVQLAHYLHANSFAVSVVNAMRVRRFGELFCQLDKTDDLDALTLARFGASLRPQLWAPPPPIYEEIFQRIVQRGALVQIRAQTANRRHALNYRIAHIHSVRTRQDELHKLLRRQIKGIDRELARVIAQDADWQATADRITSIPGVGLVTAAWLMMLTNNFTTCESPKELAAFIGLIPRRRQSGESLNTYRSVGHVGHDDIRQHLYVATMSCLRYNPTIRTYYDHMKARRGKHKLACVAATRKLVHIIWAVAKNGTVFDPEYEQKRRGNAATERKRT